MSLTTMYPAKNNSPTTTLTADLNSSDTTMTVDDPSVFPTAPNLAVIGSSDTAEIVLYTEISGNDITIVRGQNGTTPGVWGTGSPVARNFTAMDHEAFRENILDLENRKLDSVSWGDVGGTLADQTDLKNALDAKQNTLTFDSTPTASSTNPVESGGVKTYADDKILYFASQTVSVASSAQVMRIPASGTNSKITQDTVVASCIYASPESIASELDWTSYAGYVTFTGTVTSATTANVLLVKKGN